MGDNYVKLAVCLNLFLISINAYICFQGRYLLLWVFIMLILLIVDLIASVVQWW